MAGKIHGTPFFSAFFFQFYPTPPRNLFSQQGGLPDVPWKLEKEKQNRDKKPTFRIQSHQLRLNWTILCKDPYKYTTYAVCRTALVFPPGLSPLHSTMLYSSLPMNFRNPFFGFPPWTPRNLWVFSMVTVREQRWKQQNTRNNNCHFESGHWQQVNHCHWERKMFKILLTRASHWRKSMWWLKFCHSGFPAARFHSTGNSLSRVRRAAHSTDSFLFFELTVYILPRTWTVDRYQLGWLGMGSALTRKGETIGWEVPVTPELIALLRTCAAVGCFSFISFAFLSIRFLWFLPLPIWKKKEWIPCYIFMNELKNGETCPKVVGSTNNVGSINKGTINVDAINKGSKFLSGRNIPAFYLVSLYSKILKSCRNSPNQWKHLVMLLLTSVHDPLHKPGRISRYWI